MSPSWVWSVEVAADAAVRADRAVPRSAPPRPTRRPGAEVVLALDMSAPVGHTRCSCRNRRTPTRAAARRARWRCARRSRGRRRAIANVFWWSTPHASTHGNRGCTSSSRARRGRCRASRRGRRPAARSARDARRSRRCSAARRARRQVGRQARSSRTRLAGSYGRVANRCARPSRPGLARGRRDERARAFELDDADAADVHGGQRVPVTERRRLDARPRAASRMVEPSVTSLRRPSIVSSTTRRGAETDTAVTA